MASPLRTSRDFRLLFLAGTVSDVGTAVTVVALPLVAALQLHASTFATAALVAAEGAAWPLLALPIGVWVDRSRKRPLMAASDVARMALFGSVPVAAAIGWLSLWQLYVVAVAAGACTIAFGVAYQALVPQLVDESELVAGNAVLVGSQQVAQIGGPALGGLLVSVVGAATAIAADAASYAVSAACLLGIRHTEPTPDRAGRSPWRQEAREGWQLVWQHPVLRRLLTVSFIGNTCLSALQALSVVFLVRGVHATPGQVGLVLAAGPVGGLAGALAVGRVTARVGSARTMLVGTATAGVAGLLLPVTSGGVGLLAFAVGEVGISAGLALLNVTAGTYRQSRVPARLLGRVVAATRAVTWSSVPLGGLLGAALTTLVGLRASVATAVAGLAMTTLMLLTPQWRSARDLDDVGATPVRRRRWTTTS